MNELVPVIVILPTVVSPSTKKLLLMVVFCPTNKDLLMLVPPEIVRQPPEPRPMELDVSEKLTGLVDFRVLDSKDTESMVSRGLVPLPARNLLGVKLDLPVPP